MSEETRTCCLCHGQHTESQTLLFELWEMGKVKHLQMGHDCARTMFYNAAEADILRSQLQQALSQVDTYRQGYEELLSIIQEAGDGNG